MYQLLDQIDLVLRNDEKLLRLLYYKSSHFRDDVTVETEKRPNILELPTRMRLEITDLRFKFTPVTNDLVDKEICRIVFYPSPRRPDKDSYILADQHIDFDIFVHHEYNDIDMRLPKICDRINELFSHQRVAGIGKSKFTGGKPFTLADKGYIGYKMTYNFGSVNAK